MHDQAGRRPPGFIGKLRLGSPTAGPAPNTTGRHVTAYAVSAPAKAAGGIR